MKRIFLFSSFASFLACGVAVKEQEPYQSQGKSADYQFSLVSNSLFLTPEEEVCVASYPVLKSEYIRDGVTISGVTGNSSFSYPNCSETISENCITTSDFPAAKMDGIASKIALGQTVGGITGTTAIQTQANCSEGGQSDCIATATYQTMDLSEQGNSEVESITTANFSTRIAASASFEYWDASGNRNVSAGDADLISSNLRSGVDIFGTDGPTDPLDCASISVGGTWIMVPGNPDYGTNDFCVMKYEAKCTEALGTDCAIATHSPISQAANRPWVSIKQPYTVTECASLGKGFHLMTNDEWMTIGANIVNVGSNWSSGTVGSGHLYRGHSDNSPTVPCPADNDDNKAYVEDDAGNSCTAYSKDGTEDDENTQRRTHTLSNGQVIWDIAGNADEWVQYFNEVDKATPVTHDWYEYSLPVVGTSAMPLTDLIPQIAIDNGWDSSNSIGKYLSRPNGGDRGGMRRGSNYYRGDKVGVFAIHMDPPSTQGTSLGFRCVISVP